MPCLRLLLGLLLAAVLPAGAVTVSRALVLPDGNPAAGATATVRVYTVERLVREVRVRADAQGCVAAEAPAADVDGKACKAYLLVEAPGCALTFAGIGLPDDPARDAPLHLRPAYTQTGMVIAKGSGLPLARVTVGVSALGLGDARDGFPVNVPPNGFSTPKLTAPSNAAGVFALPGVALEDEPGHTVDAAWASLWALMTLPEGKGMYGETNSFPLSPRDDFRPAQTTLELIPTTPMRGRVVDVTTGRPIVGARVRLSGESGVLLGVLAPTLTNADGRYYFPHAPPAQRLYVTATRAGYGAGASRIVRTIIPHNTPLPVEGVMWTIPHVKLRPIVPLRGIIREDGADTPPAVPCVVTAVYDFTEYRVKPGDFRVVIDALHARASADGTFVLDVPAGRNDLTFRAPGYQVAKAEMHTKADVRAVTVILRRRPGLLLRVIGDPATLRAVGLELRNDATGDTAFAPPGSLRDDGYWFFDTTPYHPGGAWELSLTRDGDTLLPWTALTGAWPQEIAWRP